MQWGSGLHIQKCKRKENFFTWVINSITCSSPGSGISELWRKENIWAQGGGRDLGRGCREGIWAEGVAEGFGQRVWGVGQRVWGFGQRGGVWAEGGGLGRGWGFGWEW